MPEDNSPKRLAYEVKMMLSSVASHGPAALTTTSDPMYTARLLGRLRDALEAATSSRAIQDDVAFMATDAPLRCGRRIRNSVPDWAGSDQMDPCECIRPHGHAGECKCSHLDPDDAVPVHTDGDQDA